MNLTEMLTLIRIDLKDEVTPYQWSDAELQRHIDRAVKELSEKVPLLVKATLDTTAGSREISLAALADRIMVQAVEYPVGKFPNQFQHFSIWGHTLTLLGDEVPDGSPAYIYYGKLHTLDAATSTIPPKYEDLVATGAAGYAAIFWAAYAIDEVNVGGTMTPREYRLWGNEKLKTFREELKRLGRDQRVRTSQLFLAE